MSARFALRAATAQAHEQLDALFSTFDLSDRQGYATFLRAQAGAFMVVETALDHAGVAQFVGDWQDRRRSAALLDDLATLGAPAPTLTSASASASELAIRFGTPAAFLGSLYVLEGSRLGGALLIKSVPADLPRAFLSAGSSGSWRAFVALLDERLQTPGEIEAAAAAAIATFGVFASSARTFLGADPQ